MSRRWFRVLLAFLVGGGVGLGGALVAAPRRVLQPFPFSHAPHTAKADCTLCHRGAREGQRAGIPGMQVCTACHATPPGPTGKRWWTAAAQGKGPRWNRLHRLPSHVYFSHRRHTTVAGIKCATCHGEMGSRTTPPEMPLRALRMRACISCHEKKRVTADCTACHR